MEITGSSGYSSIPDSEPTSNDDGSDDSKSAARTIHGRRKENVLLCFGIVGALALGLSLGRASAYFAPSTSSADAPTESTSKDEDDEGTDHVSLPMPKGVNLGSWLSLEDYFYVGPTGAVEVATPDDAIAARCLPPLHTGPSTGPMWHSETDLYGNLTSMEGGSVKETIKMFHAFRTSYLDWEEELAQIAKLGIESVRVPISWCLTDYDPTTDEILGKTEDDDSGDDDVINAKSTDAELEKRFTCLDPFFEDKGVNVRWPAVPKPFLLTFLRACARHNLKATLDIHTYMGGTSLGTFSGVWPRKPLFWKYDDPENAEGDVGRKHLRNFLSWIESLIESDPLAFQGIGAITPMNEPAHLAGILGPGSSNPDAKSFLPSLPSDMARGFLAKLNANVIPGHVAVPDGPHLRVLKWQSDALSYFRSTSLPAHGIDCAVNVHESIYTQSLVPKDADNISGGHPAATEIFGVWWRQTTSPEERATWAVLDMHHYHAWDEKCQGAVYGPPMGNYTCGDIEATRQTLARCATWAGFYRDNVDDAPTRLASAEFSASTHHSVLSSCTDTTTLRTSYLTQVEAANKAGIELYWWSWKMPHGGAFRPAWSFKHFLYRLGVDGFGPDESEIICGS